LLAATLVESICRRARAFSAKAWTWVAIPLLVHPIEGNFRPLRHFSTTAMAGSENLRSSHRQGFFENDAAIAAARRQVLDYIGTNTAPTERILIGTQSHEQVRVNDIDLYFLANRLPAVRYTQYEPNIVTRREIQEQMIASLEKHRMRVAILSHRFPGSEGQAGQLPGSKLFDEYLQAHFDLVENHGVYAIMVRKP
jgi:hypothetical protein